MHSTHIQDRHRRTDVIVEIDPMNNPPTQSHIRYDVYILHRIHLRMRHTCGGAWIMRYLNCFADRITNRWHNTNVCCVRNIDECVCLLMVLQIDFSPQENRLLCSTVLIADHLLWKRIAGGGKCVIDR